MQMFKK